MEKGVKIEIIKTKETKEYCVDTWIPGQTEEFVDVMVKGRLVDLEDCKISSVNTFKILVSESVSKLREDFSKTLKDRYQDLILLMAMTIPTEQFLKICKDSLEDPCVLMPNTRCRGKYGDFNEASIAIQVSLNYGKFRDVREIKY